MLARNGCPWRNEEQQSNGHDVLGDADPFLDVFVGSYHLFHLPFQRSVSVLNAQLEETFELRMISLGV